MSSSADKVAFVGLLATLPPGHHLLRLWTWTAYLYRQLTRSRSHAAVDRSRAQGMPAALREVALKALLASVAYRPGTYKGQLTVFEPALRDLCVPSSAALWRRHASELRHENLQARHDDMLEGANAQSVADLLTRCLESAAQVRQVTPGTSTTASPPNMPTVLGVASMSYCAGRSDLMASRSDMNAWSHALLTREKSR